MFASWVLLAAAAAAAANAAPTSPPIVLPVAYKHNFSFFDGNHQAAALARFVSVIGEPESANIAEHHKAASTMMRAQPRPGMLNEVQAAAEIVEHVEETSVAEPSIADINRPIAQYLHAGDIMMTPEQLQQMSARMAMWAGDEMIRHKRGAPIVTATRWPKNQPIAYIFDSDIPESRRVRVRTAMAKLNAGTCLSYKENSTVGTQLKIHNGGGCWSYTGQISTTQQLISLENGCENIAVIAHELSHALGIEHTQNRYDRDSYITVNMANVQKDQENNFLKRTSKDNDNFGVPYDFGSIMQYGSADFSINGQPIMIPKDADFTKSLGQRKYITFNDFKMINILYNCSASCPKQMVCQNGGYPSPKDCNACVCSDFYTGANCQTPKTTITLASGVPSTTAFHQEHNPTLYATVATAEWDEYGKDAVKIIRAPEGKRIRVTINKVYAAYGGLGCYSPCAFVGLEFVDTAAGDLTTVGKIFCCKKDEGYSFVSQGNVIGYKAYAAPGMPFDGEVTYTVV